MLSSHVTINVVKLKQIIAKIYKWAFDCEQFLTGKDDKNANKEAEASPPVNQRPDYTTSELEKRLDESDRRSLDNKIQFMTLEPKRGGKFSESELRENQRITDYVEHVSGLQDTEEPSLWKQKSSQPQQQRQPPEKK